ncbi:hypothetical protein AVEN_18595-1 [Araneus ventricosus]|uniref:Integrase catalytic domain-containing protein n=1 Tax=Araneus ventricosus TaxID=182803 RepID=A0A4Y2FQK4_ARAVE|nr:hypothetical protein AVEN_18595-1 [Araneus ventricosus]
MQSNKRTKSLPLHRHYRLVLQFFRISAITGFSAQYEKQPIVDKLLSFLSYIILISQSLMILSMIITENVTTIVVGWIAISILTACFRFFLCRYASRLGKIAQRLSALNIKEDHRFNRQFNILVWSSIVYYLLDFSSMSLTCYRSLDSCGHEPFFFGFQFQGPEATLLINELLSMSFILFNFMPVNVFTVYFIVVCHDITLIFEAYRKHLTFQLVPDYRRFLQKHFFVRKLVSEIDNHISCIVFWAALANAFSIYLAVYGIAETANRLIEERIVLFIVVLYSIFMLFLMCLWADRVSSSAASLAEDVHSLEENSKGSPATHIRYLYLANRDVHLTVWDKNTKRFILQAVGKIFDPLGLITSFTIRVKCLIQDLWSGKIPWDDPLPPHIEREWKSWCEELPHLENLKIPRLVLDSTLDEDIIELHSFCDASKKAYGAAIYLKSRTRNGISVKLVTSKSRMAPLNGVTLPRLELLGALIAARLTSKMRKIVNSKRSCVQYHWTDSKIVIFWIKGSKTRWKQFVANRVNEITSLIDPNSWYHCADKENPADLLSRGMSADCLVTSNTRWWTGAEFLSDPEFPENFQSVDSDLDYLTENERETIVLERKKIPETESSNETVLLTEDNSGVLDKLLEHSNNYFKVNRILSYIFRFISNCRNKVKRPEPLTVEEIRSAENKLIQHAQISLFDKKGLSSNISNLFPFVDEERILRVGGRLENASVPYPHKHPAILPKGSKLSKIYFESLNRRLFHVGPLGMLNAVRLKFWPLSGRSIARKTVHQCVTCFKSRPILSSQIMGNLPSERVNISGPFTITGLDLCGPFLVKYKNQRKGTLNKIYICVCICFSTKAIHLELLSDLTSDALIATLKRFTSRRGRCSKIYTDNATNFVESNSKLKKFYKLINFPDENLANYFTSEGIDWNFIPPKSPHFEGPWEAGVKSVKHHLKRIIGNLHFTYEEFETIMIQTEGILNSRPLTPLSSDEDNFDVLTPGHFLIGRPISSIPEPFLTDINENRLSRWQKTTKVVQLIWKKWKSDYLNTLQARSKWMAEKDDLIIGQMVLIKDDFLLINTWLLGRIL